MFRARKREDRWSRLRGDIEFINPNICQCAPKAPKPDPLIGQAATSNAALAKEQSAVAREQLQWEKDRAEKQDPILAKIAQQQIDSADTNTARATDQWNQYKTLFQPVEAKMVTDANNWDSQARKDKMSAQAAADVTNAYGGALDSSQRNMERMGINPNSGKFAAISNENTLAQAKDTAGAMNNARDATEMQGVALRQGAAQFGRNMPNTGIAADSLALNGGQAATGTMVAGANMNNAAMQTASGLFGGAVNANNSAGQIGLGLYGNQLNAWNMKNQNNLGVMQGIGSLAGSLGGAAMFAKLRKGGMIKNGRAFSTGGMIEGPGTGDSDSVQGEIEGQEPVALSNGEAVLNAEAVQLVGEQFIHNINSGGLAMSGKKRAQPNAYNGSLSNGRAS